jgi:hypothetical protein
MTLVFVEERKTFHHPGIEPAAGVASDFARDVNAVFEPCELRTRRRGEDCDLAIFAFVTALRYGAAAAVDDDVSASVV